MKTKIIASVIVLLAILVAAYLSNNDKPSNRINNDNGIKLQ